MERSILADTIFCAHDRVQRAGALGGPLTGLSFAVKDVMRIAGARACCGNPTWLATHPVADDDAPVVQRLLEAGADLAGLVLTDEMTLSLTGENAHYGTPINAAAPGRVPGGSSSGSAAAVAAGLVSFALGTDTGGSVRVPASYCGVYGMRPTHGRVTRKGVVPLCPTFDTVGWFARDGEILRRVGAALLGSWTAVSRGREPLLLQDAVELLAPDMRVAFETTCAAHFGPIARVRLSELDLPPLTHWVSPYLTMQNAGLWTEHRAWLDAHEPAFGALIQSRFDMLAAPNPVQVAEAEELRRRVRDRLAALLERGARLVVPSAGGTAHLRGLPVAQVEAITSVGLALSSIASLTGSPQVSLPLVRSLGLPLGLGVIGAAGSDEALLDESCRLIAHTAPDSSSIRPRYPT